MLNYVRSRWAYLSECGKYSEKHFLVKLLIFLAAVYNFLALIQPAVQFPNIEFALPKLPIPWALRLVLAAISWLLIEGAYRRSQETESEKSQLELDKNTLEHKCNNSAGELGTLYIALESAGKDVDKLHKAMAKQNDEIERLTWPPNRPKLSFHSWGQRQPESVLAGTNQSSLFSQRGFHLSNDGGAALEVTVERFVIDDKFSAFGSTIARIEGGTPGFSPIILENEPPLAKYGLDQALSRAWEEKVKNKEIAFNEPLVLLVSVVYRDFNDLWYRSSAGLIFTHTGGTQIGGIEFTAGTHRIEFTAVKQERLGTTPPWLIS